jgi:signal peptidase II
MTALLLGALLVPAVDQSVKLLVLSRLEGGCLSLGPLGEVRVARARIWMMRTSRRVPGGVMWAVWIAATVASVAICRHAPAAGWALGLLVGGGLSHALETSFRGSVCDFVHLRFWPAFDLADVALALGAVGFALHLARAAA